MKSKYINLIFTIISIMLWLISMSQKAYCVDGNCGEPWSGLICLLFGFLSLFFYSYAAVSWFLNPLMIISYFIPLKNINTKLLLALASVLFGLSFLLFDEIVKNEAGHFGKITGYEIGYWLWVASAIINLIGIIINKLTTLRNTKKQSSVIEKQWLNL